VKSGGRDNWRPRSRSSQSKRRRST
jgi:hypothetical protein